MAVDHESEDHVVVNAVKGECKEEPNASYEPASEDQGAEQGRVKVEQVISLLDPKKNDSMLYGAINRWFSSPACSKLQSPLDEAHFAEIKGRLSEISMDENGFASCNDVAKVLQDEPLSMEVEEAFRCISYVQQRNFPQRTVEVAKKNIQSLVSVAGAAKDKVLVGAEKATETISTQADIVSHWIVDEDRILGSRRLRQLTDVVVDPETSSKGSRVLGSRRLAGLRNFLFGPDEPADPGIISCHTFTTDVAPGDSKVEDQEAAAETQQHAEKDVGEEPKDGEQEALTLSEKFFEEAAEGATSSPSSSQDANEESGSAE